MTVPIQPPSLCEVLERAGVVDRPTLDGLVLLVRERLRAGTPASLGRLLLERGVPAPRILAAAATGGMAGALRCDACSTIQAATAPAGREFPCARCGAFLLPLGAGAPPPPGAIRSAPSETVIDFAVMPLPTVLTPASQPEPNEDTTVPIMRDEPTIRFGGVMPIPGPPPDSATLPFTKVLPLPPVMTPPRTSGYPASELPTGTYPTADMGPTQPGVGIPPTFNTKTPAPSTLFPPVESLPVPPIVGNVRITTVEPPFGMNSEAPTQADPEGDTPPSAPAPGSRNTTLEGPGVPQRPAQRRASARMRTEDEPEKRSRILVLAALGVLATLALGALVAVLVWSSSR